MQPNDVGTQRDLVLYRIEAAKEDLKSAKILRDADSYKGANNRAYYAIFHAKKYGLTKTQVVLKALEKLYEEEETK